ncbi:hypothetical protein NC653_006970 [Populus alba x Populus x berolinensis]|uniref:Uncharacterized protein n=2 Tax=Populus TaxID=3689 RepID=A0A4U5LT63_POPAL|nr:hypothetical protein NC653_006970 [Populus alba x Populus x berolinensis]TKR59241.1 hypothetical protein D5086_0000325880 [Populus alba]
MLRMGLNPRRQNQNNPVDKNGNFGGHYDHNSGEFQQEYRGFGEQDGQNGVYGVNGDVQLIQNQSRFDSQGLMESQRSLNSNYTQNAEKFHHGLNDHYTGDGGQDQQNQYFGQYHQSFNGGTIAAKL